MTVNAHSFAALNKGLKYNYAKRVADLVRAEAPMLNMLEDDGAFEKRGGRSLIWPLITDRPMNFGVRSETDFFPGMSTDTNDDIDTHEPVEASQSIGYAYATAAFTEHQMAKAHKDFQLFKGWDFARHVKSMQDDFRMQLEWMLLGDKTGFLGQVSSVSHAAGVTTVGVQPASTISTRGIHGTQRLYKNQKISFIRAANWATSPRTATIDSNVAGLGTPIHKIRTVSKTMDTRAAPTFTLTGDYTAATALAVGDIIVMGKSRASASGGSNAASEALALLRCFDGLFNLIDDGTLDANLYGLVRADNTILNSETDLSAVGRQLTQDRLQVMFDNLRRRRGHDDGDIEDEYMLITERSVATNIARAEGEAAKRYLQEDKAKRLVAGWKNVTMAFLENETLLPHVRYNTMPYGHALLLRRKTLKALWDIKPGLVNADGLQIRQIQGKPQYYMALQAVGAFKDEEPWFAGRLSGLNGTFSV